MTWSKEPAAYTAFAAAVLEVLVVVASMSDALQIALAALIPVAGGLLVRAQVTPMVTHEEVVADRLAQHDRDVAALVPLALGQHIPEPPPVPIPDPTPPAGYDPAADVAELEGEL